MAEESRWRRRSMPGLANSFRVIHAPGGLRIGHVRDAQHRIVVEIGLLHLAVLNGDYSTKQPKTTPPSICAATRSGLMTWPQSTATAATRRVPSFAHVAEVTVAKDGTLRVDRVVVAVDCGQVINPDLVAAQIEGGVVFGLTSALYDEITIQNGQVQQTNFDNYPMLRIADMPKVEVHLVPSHESPGGIGEPGVPSTAPAVANAIFAATGKRLRRLPFQTQELAKS